MAAVVVFVVVVFVVVVLVVEVLVVVEVVKLADDVEFAEFGDVVVVVDVDADSSFLKIVKTNENIEIFTISRETRLY